MYRMAVWFISALVFMFEMQGTPCPILNVLLQEMVNIQENKAEYSLCF